MDWDEWRLLTDKRLNIQSPAHLNTYFSLNDGLDAIDVIEELNRAENEAQAAAMKRE